MKHKFAATFLILTTLIAIISLSFIQISAAQPEMELGSGNVLFRAAPGSKSGSVGFLSPTGTYDGSVFDDTVIDSSRSFSVNEESASTVLGGTLTFTYSGATSGINEYVSMLVTDTTGKILYYGKLKSISGTSDESGFITVTVPALARNTSYLLYIFSEKCTSSGDIASSASNVTLFVYPDPYITTTSLPDTTQGVSYKNVHLKAESSSPSLTWSIQSGALPNGLFLDPATGYISGSPTETGEFRFFVRATVGTSHDIKELVIKVNPPITIDFTTDITSGTLDSISVPLNRNVTLTASVENGTPPYSQYAWSVNGSIIPGASNLSYKIPTDTLGTFLYTFVATDTATANSSANFTVMVREPVNPEISRTTGQFDRVNSSPIIFTKNDGDYPFTGILIDNSAAISEGSDYTISGDTVTIKEEFLHSLTIGTHTFTLDYEDTDSDPVITVNIIDTSLPPVIATLGTPDAVNTGSMISIVAPDITTSGTAITDQGWKIKTPGAADFTDFFPTTVLSCSDNGSVMYYYATNCAGTSESNRVTITVNHVPSTEWSYNNDQHWHACICGEKFDVGNHVLDENGRCTICGEFCHHEFTEFKSDNNATCTADGTKSHYCTKCGYRETVIDTGSKKGHTWSMWQVDEIEHWKVCTTCGAKSNIGAHVPGPEATEDSPQVCLVCGKILNDKIPKPETTPHPDETTSPDHTETTSPIPETTVPDGTTTVTPETTTDPSGTETAKPEDTTNPFPETTTNPSGSDTAIPEDTTDPGAKPVIHLKIKPGDDKNAPTFISDKKLIGIITIIVNGNEIGKDEYTVSNGNEITLHTSTPLNHGSNTLFIETFDCKGEITFNYGDNLIKDDLNGGFPFWLLWVIPHLIADLTGIILIIVLVCKKDKKDDSPEDTPEDKTDDEKKIDD